MPWLSLMLVLLTLVVIATVAVLVAGGARPVEEAPPDRAPGGSLPEGELTRDDIDRLRFSLGFRGYRMDEVDEVLDRLARELVRRDERIADLEGRPGSKPVREG